MIEVNGKRFAESEEEFSGSLFKSGGTCCGYYKRLKRRISLYDHNHALVGAINSHGCVIAAHLQDDGQYFWNHGVINIVGDIPSMDALCCARDLSTAIDWVRGEKVYRFTEGGGNE